MCIGARRYSALAYMHHLLVAADVPAPVIRLFFLDAPPHLEKGRLAAAASFRKRSAAGAAANPAYDVAAALHQKQSQSEVIADFVLQESDAQSAKDKAKGAYNRTAAFKQPKLDGAQGGGAHSWAVRKANSDADKLLNEDAHSTHNIFAILRHPGSLVARAGLFALPLLRSALPALHRALAEPDAFAALSTRDACVLGLLFGGSFLLYFFISNSMYKGALVELRTWGRVARCFVAASSVGAYDLGAEGDLHAQVALGRVTRLPLNTRRNAHTWHRLYTTVYRLFRRKAAFHLCTIGVMLLVDIVCVLYFLVQSIVGAHKGSGTGAMTVEAVLLLFDGTVCLACVLLVLLSVARTHALLGARVRLALGANVRALAMDVAEVGDTVEAGYAREKRAVLELLERITRDLDGVAHAPELFGLDISRANVIKLGGAVLAGFGSGLVRYGM